MLSPSLSPFRQRRRKASTPFLPGAWPSSSGSEEPSKDDANNSVIEIHEGKSDVPQKALGRTSPALPHLDHVMKFHRRISDTLSPTSRRQSAVSAESLTVAGVTKSTAEPGPPQHRRPNVASVHDPNLPRQKSRILSKRSNAQKAGARLANAMRDNAPKSRQLYADDHVPASVSIEHHAQRLSSVRSDYPHNTTRHPPPLQLTCNNFTSPRSGISNQPSPIYPSSPDADSPAPPSASSTSPSFSDSISSQRGLLQSPSGIASTFYPVLDHPPTKRFGLPTPSTSGSSYAFTTDSPILPFDEHQNSAPSQYPTRPPNATQLLTPSSADMDVFGFAASAEATSPSQSAMSLPTSFQSASDEGSMPISESMSANETERAQLRGRSVSLSSMGSELELGEFPRPASHNDDDLLIRGRRSGAPSPSSFDGGFTRPDHVSQTFEIQSQKVEYHVLPLKTGKFAPFIKVKKLGGRIKKFLRAKLIVGENKTNDRRTAPSRNEYTSEHPIPRPISRTMVPSVPAGSPKPKDSSQMSPQRRQSMPITSETVPNVSRPRPLRPTSFLPMDDATKRSPLVSMPNLITFSPRPRQVSLSSPTTRKDVSHGDPANDGVHDPGRPMRPRARTQTAPPCQETLPSKASRRFSLTAALSRSTLDALRTTVVPHPALPKGPSRRSHTQDDFIHRRSGSTSANDAWNAAKGGDSPKSELLHRDRWSRPLNIVPGAEETWGHSSPDTSEPLRGTEPKELYEGVPGETTDPTAPTRVSSRRASLVNPPAAQFTRPRSNTHSSIIGRSPNTSRDMPQEGQHGKRRSRGFSLSSVISKRALRARSMVVGRSSDHPNSPNLIGNPKDGEFVTSVSGVSFSMVTPPPPPPPEPGKSSTEFEVRTASGCADYDPDLVLDKMSFAETPEIRSTVGSHTDLLMSVGSTSDIAVHSVVLLKNPPLSTSTSFSTSGDDPNDGAECVSGEEEEVEEEREFMRALGLQFDEIVRRARDE